MSIAASQQSFLANAITPLHITGTRCRCRTSSFSSVTFIACSSSGNQPADHDPDNYTLVSRKQWAKLAVVALAAGVLTLGSVDDASAAKTGGRIGGQAFRSSAPRPRSSSPRPGNSSRTNIYINPGVAPPLVGGYGYGYGYGVPFYGGWGWSPFSFFAPGPSVAVGIGGGFDILVLFMFLGAAAAVVRRFIGPKDEDDDY